MDTFGWDDGDDSPADEVVQVVAASEGVTARGIAASLRFPVDEVTELLEELHANGELERDGDGLWVVPNRAGPTDPYMF
jgi:DNA-binding IclR family transcriptional regulator